MDKEQALRYNAEKLAYEELPLDLLDGVTRVLQMGAKKYVSNNWRKGSDISQLRGCFLRHYIAWVEGEDLDPESGESHLDHAICNLIFMKNVEKNLPSFDDRAKWNTKIPKDENVKTNNDVRCSCTANGDKCECSTS